MWKKLASSILRHRLLLALALLVFTLAMGSQLRHIKLSYRETNLLPDRDPITLDYENFRRVFGQEDNLVVLGIQDEALFTPSKLKAWEALATDIRKEAHVNLVLTISDLKILQKDTRRRRFVLRPLSPTPPETKAQAEALKQALLRYPFYDKLLYNRQSGAMRMAVYLNPKYVNTPWRKAWVLRLQQRVKRFEKAQGLHVYISGMPVVRTMSSVTIVSEVAFFVGLALLITSLLFYLFFRSFIATLVSMTVVVIAVFWSFGTIGALGYPITILTAVIPPLIIVIGVPNCIFLINKYQQEYKRHQNKMRALSRVIAKVGNATLFTNVTTAFGFFTFLFTSSKSLMRFGLVASLNIMGVFVLSLLIIPILYSYLPEPKARHLRHLSRRWVERFIGSLAFLIRARRRWIYLGVLLLMALALNGIRRVHRSGNPFDDLPKDKTFYKDIRFFDAQFGGVLPLEIYLDAGRRQGIERQGVLRRMDSLSRWIEAQQGLNKPVSLVDLVKFSRQAFYGGDPAFYSLPSAQERPFILSYAKRSGKGLQLLKNYVDSTGQKARITTLMKNMNTEAMGRIFEGLKRQLKRYFPADQFHTYLTGAAYVYYKGTKYLINNIGISLGLAVLLIALFMATVFRSVVMAVISLLPNLLPLLMTAGLMGYCGIPIKPSTILVFSIAFGISVDDTIHFLAKYRQELQVFKGDIQKSVLLALRETGVSMFYTSIVLFFGFSIFMLSSFGGTQALGGLISITLLFSMVTNLLLLPALLLTFKRAISVKRFRGDKT